MQFVNFSLLIFPLMCSSKHETIFHSLFSLFFSLPFFSSASIKKSTHSFMTDKRNLCIFQTDINTKKAAGGMPEELDRQTIFSSSLRMILIFVSVILRFCCGSVSLT